MRMLAIAEKEMLHIMRDARTMVIALLVPLFLIILFGIGVSLDVDHIPLTIEDHVQSSDSRALARRFTANGEFVQGQGATLVIEAHGAAMWIDGSDATTATQILQRANAVPVRGLSTWTRFNLTGKSSIFIIPGLTAFVLALGAVLLTALTIAGEWERGSMEQLFASPVGRVDIIVGKLLPYLAIGLLQLLLVLTVGVVGFDVPVRGNIFLIAPFGLAFLTGMLGLGLLVSVVTKNQLVATQMSLLVAMLPSMLLSGMLFPIANMPVALQVLSSVIPARYLVSALRGIMLKGQGLDVLWPHLVALVVFATAIVAIATAKFKRKLA